MQLLEFATDASIATRRVLKEGGFAAFRKRFQSHLCDMVDCRKFLRNAQNAATAEEVIELVFASKAIRPLQRIPEITALAEVVKHLSPRRMLEIGTAEGGTLAILSRCAAPDATIISIDLPFDGPFGGGYRAWRSPVYRRFSGLKQIMRLLRADSHSPTTLEVVRKELAGEPLDFLFIDGDHTYDGVKTDFEIYSPLVRRGGLIAMHDIIEPIPANGYGVHRLWAEIQPRYRTQEIVAEPKLDKMGIGLIWI